MRTLTWLASVAAELLTGARRRRCPHRMVEMVDGPVCGSCGRSWRWS